ncbi:MAG: hypothetical protein C5S49_02580 [Candidatus Methanogaster sp.]|nr:MAG: hypothetical protein C5S49_02580 [ANME-2 cluster archaeon]
MILEVMLTFLVEGKGVCQKTGPVTLTSRGGAFDDAGMLYSVRKTYRVMPIS